MPTDELRRGALAALRLREPVTKTAMVEALAGAALVPDPDLVLADPGDLPGRPERPELVDPRSLAQRDVGSRDGRAALLHALAHIEFNAINLALDAVWRFCDMPGDYYRDWLRVAAEEARHFGLLAAHLSTLDCRYGDFSAHGGLWQMAERTRGDVLARMALVPRTLEARGLDASPLVRAKFESVGDRAAAAIIDVILADEIGHVAVGNRWFHHLCRARGLEPVAAFAELAARHAAPRPRGPFNVAARRAAGFLEHEIVALTAGDA